MADFPPIKAEKFLQDILPRTEANKELLEKLDALRHKETIDGIRVTDKDAAPLCCMDINILTGLRPTSHDRLKVWFEETAKEIEAESGQKNSKLDFPFDMGAKPCITNRMREKAEKLQDHRLSRSIDIAFERVCNLQDQMEMAVEREFQGKTPSENPQFMMSMGGGGSGKSAAKDIISAVSDENYIEASLDAFRSHSDLYALLLAVGHHADDYTLVQGIASNLRDRVKDKALQEKYSLIYDGTGIDYAGRYDKIAADFKKSGYETRLSAVDTSMENAIRNVNGRYEREGRALLWPVVTQKHANFPDSFMAAVADENLDHVMLFANDKDYGQHHLVAETHKMKPADVDELRQSKEQGTLTEVFSKWQNHANSVLSLLKEKDSGFAHRSPEMQEENLNYLRFGEKAESRVLCIYQANRFTQMLQKGQLNKAASSSENLLQLPRALKFAVAPKGNMLQIQ